MQVELWDVSRPIPYGKNPRTIPESAISKVTASIKSFGFRQPIVVDKEGVIVVGHTRLLAAQRLGLKEVPVHVATDLSKTDARAYRIADNRVGTESTFSNDLLALELGDLKLEGFDLELTGFNIDELVALEALGNSTSEGLTDEDAVPETPEDPVTILGDVWQLGNHRLMCGDSTSSDTVAKLLGSVKPHLMVTDPPYGMEFAVLETGLAIGNRQPSGR